MEWEPEMLDLYRTDAEDHGYKKGRIVALDGGKDVADLMVTDGQTRHRVRERDQCPRLLPLSS